MKGVNIYLAEDDADDVLFFSEALGEVCRESTVRVCSNGDELLKKLNSPQYEMPDMIFLDINMPIMDGLECLKKIKTNPNLKNIPVIILTTSSSRTTIEITYRLGANYFVKKPACFKDLKKMLRSAIQIDWCTYCRPANATGFVYNYH